MRLILVLTLAGTLHSASAAQDDSNRSADEAELQEHLDTMTTSRGRDRAFIGYAIPTTILLLGGIGYAWIHSTRRHES